VAIVSSSDNAKHQYVYLYDVPTKSIKLIQTVPVPDVVVPLIY